MSAADEAAGYMVTASRAGGGLDAGLRVAGKAAGVGGFGIQGGDSSGAVEGAGSVLAGITAAAEGAAVEAAGAVVEPPVPESPL